MLNQLKARTQAISPANQKDSLIDYTFDPSRQNNPPYKTIYQPTPSDGYARTVNTLLTNPTGLGNTPGLVNTSLKHSNLQTTTTHPSNVDKQTRPSGLSTHPTIQHRDSSNQARDRLERVASRIHTHFKTKYPALIDASGFSTGTIMKIIHQIKLMNLCLIFLYRKIGKNFSKNPTCI